MYSMVFVKSIPTKLVKTKIYIYSNEIERSYAKSFFQGGKKTLAKKMQQYL